MDWFVLASTFDRLEQIGEKVRVFTFIFMGRSSKG
jgi:hypothetical protein